MAVKVMFFGELRDKVGATTLEREIGNTDALHAELSRDFPELSGMTLLTAVNQEIVRNNTELKDGDEVAIMPPFAGG